MREGLRRELLTQKVIEREIGAKVAVTDQDVTDFFNANRAQFNFPEEAYHIAQIVVTPVRDAAARQPDRRRCHHAAGGDGEGADADGTPQGGASFRDLAMDFSEDPESAPRGGDLGFVPLSALKQAPPPLRDAVLKARRARSTW